MPAQQEVTANKCKSFWENGKYKIIFAGTVFFVGAVTGIAVSIRNSSPSVDGSIADTTSAAATPVPTIIDVTDVTVSFSPTSVQTSKPPCKTPKQKRLPRCKETNSPTVPSNAPTVVTPYPTSEPTSPPTEVQITFPPTPNNIYGATPIRLIVACPNYGSVYMDSGYSQERSQYFNDAYLQSSGGKPLVACDRYGKCAEAAFLVFYYKNPAKTAQNNNPAFKGVIPLAYAKSEDLFFSNIQGRRRLLLGQDNINTAVFDELIALGESQNNGTNKRLRSSN